MVKARETGREFDNCPRCFNDLTESTYWSRLRLYDPFNERREELVRELWEIKREEATSSEGSAE